MSGRNQHYIPGFVQRAFGIRKKRRQWIWRFGREGEPECRRIKKTGAEDYFYAKPSADGQPTLDDAITAVEQRMSSRLNAIRSGSPGDPVDADAAAAVVAHLATRTAHVRSTFGDGVGRLLQRTEELFGDPANVGTVLGLDGAEPNRLVREVIARELARWPQIAQTGIPTDVVERVGFALLKESWGDLTERFAGLAARLVDEMRSRTGEAIRDGHNKGLEAAARSSDFEATLRTFEWTVESGPPTGGILPDCVVVALDADGNAGNHLLVGARRLHAMVMAVSPEKLLVGKRPGFAMPAFGYNEEAAKLCHDFFLAPRNDAETERLGGTIGTGLGPALEESLEGAFDEFLPKGESAAGTEPEAGERSTGWIPTTELEYDVSVTGCGDESAARSVEEQLREFVGAIATAMPLDRLDGIAVSDDYPATLREVDRGYESAPTAETVSADVGVGVAQTVTVLRSGVVKGRIVLSNAVWAAMTAEDRMVADWGVQAFVSQLVRVAVIRMTDEAVPGDLMAPAPRGMAGWLYRFVDGVPDVYVASWTTAAFVDGAAVAGRERELFVWSLDRLRTTAAAARRAYAGEDTVWEYLDAVLPAIGHVLSFGASLLGHCGSSGLSAVDDDLAAALDRAGLGGWLDAYRGDLERFRRRLGRWESFEEFLGFGRHVERLLWAIGMILWEEGETMHYRMADGDVVFSTAGTE